MKHIDKLEPISLQDMEQVRLMNRIDTKYLTTVRMVEKLLELACGQFLVQEIDGRRLMTYNTVYYDTPDENMYYQHQRGKKSRRKVRIREYVDSNTTPFLEIKNKNNKGRTKKKRVAFEPGASIDEYADFIGKHTEYEAEALCPQIENRFLRITLVNKEKTERITIDTSLEFHNFATGIKKSLPELAIIEWKRDGLSSNSRLKPLLRELRIKENGFSKYCIGMALTNPDLRQNRLKQRLRLVEKITNDSNKR